LTLHLTISADAVELAMAKGGAIAIDFIPPIA
jgi:hypothetical protein